MTEHASASVPAVTADDHADGPAGAQEVVFYGEFTCPRCAVAWTRLRQEPVRLVFRHFALKAKDPRGVALARAAEAAGRQGAFFAFADGLFSDQGHQDDPHLWARCEALGLDLTRFEADRRDPAVTERVARDVKAGLHAGVVTTPTLFSASWPRGREWDGLVPEWTFGTN